MYNVWARSKRGQLVEGMRNSSWDLYIPEGKPLEIKAPDASEGQAASSSDSGENDARVGNSWEFFSQHRVKHSSSAHSLRHAVHAPLRGISRAVIKPAGRAIDSVASGVVDVASSVADGVVGVASSVADGVAGVVGAPGTNRRTRKSLDVEDFSSQPSSPNVESSGSLKLLTSMRRIRHPSKLARESTSSIQAAAMAEAATQPGTSGDAAQVSAFADIQQQPPAGASVQPSGAQHVSAASEKEQRRHKRRQRRKEASELAALPLLHIQSLAKASLLRLQQMVRDDGAVSHVSERHSYLPPRTSASCPSSTKLLRVPEEIAMQQEEKHELPHARTSLPGRLAPAQPLADDVVGTEDVTEGLHDTVAETDKLDVQSAMGTLFVNQYVVIQSLGSGTFGKVKLALNLYDEELYAIKLVSKGRAKRRNYGKVKKAVDPAMLSQLGALSEVEVLRNLSHPNLVKLYEVIDDPNSDKLLMVMEYVEGGAVMVLESSTDKVMALPEESCRQYFRDAVKGLVYLHENMLVHGDIKPDNLLLSADGNVKIADFGSSRILAGVSQEMTRTIGTPAYLAPEVVEGIPYHGRTADTWALGVTLYALLTGELPFKGRTLLALYDAILEGSYTWPEGCTVSQAARDLVDAILQKYPAKRLSVHDMSAHRWTTADGLLNVPQEEQDEERTYLPVSTVLQATASQQHELDGAQSSVMHVGNTTETSVFSVPLQSNELQTNAQLPLPVQQEAALGPVRTAELPVDTAATVDDQPNAISTIEATHANAAILLQQNDSHDAAIWAAERRHAVLGIDSNSELSMVSATSLSFAMEDSGSSTTTTNVQPRVHWAVSTRASSEAPAEPSAVLAPGGPERAMDLSGSNEAVEPSASAHQRTSLPSGEIGFPSVPQLAHQTWSTSVLHVAATASAVTTPFSEGPSSGPMAGTGASAGDTAESDIVRLPGDPATDKARSFIHQSRGEEALMFYDETRKRSWERWDKHRRKMRGQLEPYFEYMDLPVGAWVVRQGDPVECMYFIREGEVELWHDSEAARAHVSDSDLEEEVDSENDSAASSSEAAATPTVPSTEPATTPDVPSTQPTVQALHTAQGMALPSRRSLMWQARLGNPASARSVSGNLSAPSGSAPGPLSSVGTRPNLSLAKDLAQVSEGTQSPFSMGTPLETVLSLPTPDTNELTQEHAHLHDNGHANTAIMDPSEVSQGTEDASGESPMGMHQTETDSLPQDSVITVRSAGDFLLGAGWTPGRKINVKNWALNMTELHWEYGVRARTPLSLLVFQRRKMIQAIQDQPHLQLGLQAAVARSQSEALRSSILDHLSLRKFTEQSFDKMVKKRTALQRSEFVTPSTISDNSSH